MKRSLVATTAAVVMGIPITLWLLHSPPVKPLLIFDHDGIGTPGYVIEETTNLVDWYVVGHVWVTNFQFTNTHDPVNFLTFYYYQPKTQAFAFYRAGTLLWPSNATPAP